MMTPRKFFAVVLGTLLCLGSGCGPTGPPPTGDQGGGSDDADGVVDDGMNGGTGEPAPALFVEASDCASCHNGLTDMADNDVSIQASWRATMMANAARDPYFLAKVSTEIEHNPALRDVIEATCAKCHMPMAATQATADGTTTAMFDAGFLNPDNPLHALAIDGVSCTVCHQIEDVALGEPASFSGGFTIDTTIASPDRVNYGPFPDPDVSVMQAVSGFMPVQSDHVSRSALCATCHTLFTPYVDAEGNLQDDTFPEQVAFLEWQHSAFADGVGEDRSCQDCHMPDADGAAALATIPNNLAPRSPFAQHHFVGGNTLMLTILKDHAAELGVQASAADFDAVISRTLVQLEDDTADLAIVDASRDGQTLTVDLRVESKAGHKLPTGFPARRAWIHLRVTDADEAVVFESGAAGTDARIAGNDGDSDITNYEPHHATITSASQVQIYEAVMIDTDGQVTYTLLRAAGYIKDNRLLPRGFDKSTAGEDFAVRGVAANDADFMGGSDEIAYRIDVTGSTGPYTVTAELLYQSVSYPFVEDIRPVGTALSDRFVSFYDDADKTPVVLAQAEQSVE